MELLGQIIFCSIGTIVIIVILVCCIIGPRPQKGPMYKRYLKPDGTFMRADRIDDKEGSICPICRMPFDRGNCAGYRQEICSDCSKKIHTRGDSFRPSFITNERDWIYLRRCRDTVFWTINSDYEKGDIDADTAGQLMNKLVPKSFGKIDESLLQYREYHDYTVSSYSWLNAFPDVRCTICGKESDYCQCHKLYLEKISRGSYPEMLKANLEELRVLKPEFVITGYYKRDGVIHADIERRSGFLIKDFFTLDDWRTLQYLLNYARREEYSQQEIEEAITKYLQLINTDLEMLIEFYEAVSKGERPRIPLLPSTNPGNIRVVEIVPKKKSPRDELSEKFTL